MSRRLTPTSFIVLGLVEAAGEATPYDLKMMVATGLGNFWSVPHAQLYTETERLAAEGLLDERRERSGRRRRLYTITQAGSEALQEWREIPPTTVTELRDLGLLKLFFGADPKRIARKQLAVHRSKLEEYEGYREQAAHAPEGVRLTIESGIGHEREFVRFWSELAGEP